MNESFLQYIWRYSLYASADLRTDSGEALTVIYSGHLNRDAGPDFQEARIRLGGLLLVGNIELHLRSSDWFRHGHQHDPAYQNIILHVVFDHDTDRPFPAPVLELRASVSPELFENYQALLQRADGIPCRGLLGSVPQLTRQSWMDSLLAERWEEKHRDWEAQLRYAGHDWGTLAYWRLASNFGFKINSPAFLALAQSLPLALLLKHRSSLLQTEALLFGQSGMLKRRSEDPYAESLRNEYAHLRHKYGLKPIPAQHWKFLRMRPSNFPTVRISQFANWIHRHGESLTSLYRQGDREALQELFDVAASSYWNDHSAFGRASKVSAVKHLGRASIQNILLNTVAPLRFLYARSQGLSAERMAAVRLLAALEPEENRITAIWTEAGWPPENAFESQALLQLYSHYCSAKKCLDCSIGNRIIRSVPLKVQ